MTKRINGFSHYDWEVLPVKLNKIRKILYSVKSEGRILKGYIEFIPKENAVAGKQMSSCEDAPTLVEQFVI